MAPYVAAAPVVLVATSESASLSHALRGLPFAVVEARTGTLAIDWARDLLPDVIVLDAELPDMTGIEACETICRDLRVGHGTPILIMARYAPTPAEYVEGLRAGVWEFVASQADAAELVLKLQTYVQAKRNVEAVMSGGFADPASGLHTRSALANRARALGSLMSRMRGALACIVVVLDPEAMDMAVARVMARCGRVSDVVGTLGPNEFAVLAPGTDAAGALVLVHRIAGMVRDALGLLPAVGPVPGLRVGYAAVANLTYTPTDPVELLGRAAIAVRNGIPEPASPWVRRFDSTRQPRSVPSGQVPENSRRGTI